MKFKRMFTAFMVVVCILAMSQAAFAAYGWGDTMEDAITMYRPGWGNYSSAYIYLDDAYDYDWYLVDNSGGSSFNYAFILTSPSGINYNMQLIKVDQNGFIYDVHHVHDNGSGQVDAIGTNMPANHKAYIRVMSYGHNDHSVPYHLQFEKFN